jgi:ATP-binding cassette subfamily B protein
MDAARTVALIVVVLRFLEPLNTLSDLFVALESTHAAAQRTLAVLDVPALPSPARDAVPQAPAIAFRNVHFHANGNHILDGISFDVPGGSTTALVGPSGSGKSTILSMIARMHDVSEGEVRVGGHDVRAYAPATLMNQLSIVFQNVQLFEGGIAENIRLARPDATEAGFMEAAKAACVDEIVERLGSWDAPVGEGGGNLSGGERQRVSIARALLKNAPILLLDEATSGLDTMNEVAVAAALSRFGHRTVLVVPRRSCRLRRRRPHRRGGRARGADRRRRPLRRLLEPSPQRPRLDPRSSGYTPILMVSCAAAPLPGLRHFRAVSAPPEQAAWCVPEPRRSGCPE